MLNPWDRMPNEPAIWFDRFDKYYRPLGPGRSLSEAYYIYYEEQHGERPERPGFAPAWGVQAKEWNWLERAEAWDAEIRRERLEQEKQTIREMTDRHVRQSIAVSKLAMETLLDKGFKDVNVALRAWKQAVEVERSARGIPDYIADIHEMDDEELTRELTKELVRAGISAPDRAFIEDAEGEALGEIAESAPREVAGDIRGAEDSCSVEISD